MSSATVTSNSARRWLVAAAAAATALVTASLGVWQLGRAAQKEALLAQRADREHLAAVDTPALLSALRGGMGYALLDRAAVLRGQWVAEATVYLDNRPMDGRAGFIVVTPLRLPGSDQVLLVQRGWVPRRLDDRTALPALVTESGEVDVQGRLAPPPSHLFALGADAGGPIRQNIDLTAYGAEWKLHPLPVSLQQTDPPDGQGLLVRHWPHVGLDVQKHYGYAFQWFGLCTLTVILYVWFQIIVPRRRR